MTLLALDLGNRTGWATWSDGIILYGSHVHKGSRFEGGGMKFVRFEKFLNQMLKKDYEIDIVVFEEVRRHIGTDAAHAYGGYLATLTAWCERHKIPYQGVPVGTIKKFATGKGNASKTAMIRAAEDRGHTPADDNEADAIMLMYYGVSQHKKLANKTHVDDFLL